MHLNNQALYADISRYNWGIKCEKVIDRLSFGVCLLGVCPANSVTLYGKSGVPSDNVERPVAVATYYASDMSSYMYCGSATYGAIAQLKGVV